MTVERSLVDRLLYVSAKKNLKKPLQSLKALRGFLSKFHTLQESHLVYGYTVILSVVLTVFLYAGCRSPYGTRGAVEMAYRLGQLAWAGVSVAHPWDSMRYDAAAVSNEALLPLNPPGNRRARGAVLICEAAAAGSFGALIMMSGQCELSGTEKRKPPTVRKGACCVGGRKILELPFHSEVSVNGCCITAEKFAPGV